jgi:phospholipid/cholesterol/gamma-HCH transport system substrate-binding protein
MLYFGINFLKGVNVFQQQHRYYIKLDNVAGLLISSPIYLHGYQIGLVNSIRMTNTNPVEFVVGLNFVENFPIPNDSRIEYSVDLFGSSSVNLILGTNSQMFTPGDTLRGSREVGLMDGISDMMPKADAMLMNVDSLLISMNKILSNPMWEQAMEGIVGTITQLNRSSTSLNRIMGTMEHDLTAISSNMNTISGNLKTLSEELGQLELQNTFSNIDEMVENLNALTARINSNDNSIGRLIHDTSLHDSLLVTLSSAAQLLENIRLYPDRYLSVRVRLFGN